MSTRERPLELTLDCMSEAAALDAATWHYEQPYNVYDSTDAALDLFLDPRSRYFGVYDTRAVLFGFCCFGAEARVPGGHYPGAEPEVLDIGVGMHPEHTGHGHGACFLRAILEFARERCDPGRFRATIAEFNRRSSRTFETVEFTPGLLFLGRSGTRFRIFARDA